MSTPDFHKAVRFALKPRNKGEEEVCRELSEHLLDEYEEALQNVSSSDRAEKEVLSQLSEPSKLRRRIRYAQGGMMSSMFRRMLLPGVLMVIVVRAFAMPLEYMGVRPQAYLFWHHAAFVWYGYLMPIFVVAAAVGAWYSRHQGGSVRDRLAAGTFYALAAFFAIVLPLPIAFVFEPQVPWATKLESFVGFLLSQVIVPAIPMLLGTLPFLFSKGKEETYGNAAPA